MGTGSALRIKTSLKKNRTQLKAYEIAFRFAPNIVL
jgi:hypothetical protein